MLDEHIIDHLLEQEPAGDEDWPRSETPEPSPRHALRQEHRQQLEARALRDNTIEQAGFWSCTDKEGRDLLDVQDDPPGDFAGLVIPYGDGYHVVRPDNPRVIGATKPKVPPIADHMYQSSPSDSEEQGKAIKYESPRRVPARIYSPERLYPDIVNPIERLYVTEGVFKALVMNQEGLPTVGLSGVWNAHDADARDDGRDWGTQQWHIAPDLMRLIFPNREVCIVFDSPDTVQNSHVIRAMVRLARMIKAADGIPLISYVPCDRTGKKRGVDDYLASRTSEVRERFHLSVIESEARPSSPFQVIDWIVEHVLEEGWERSQVVEEVERAAVLAAVWFERDLKALADWIRKAASRCRVKRDQIETMIAQVGLRRAEQQSLRSAVPGSFAELCGLLRDSKVREVVCGPGKLEVDSRTREVFLDRKSFGSEVDVSRIREALVTKVPTSHVEYRKEHVIDALTAVADENKFDPVQEYLRSLRWDSRPRIEHVQEQILRIEANENGLLNKVLIRKWFISAVARALEPGCKVDTVLILQGLQGKKKSTFFGILGGEWFTDSPIDIGNKDGMLHLAKKWIIEWPELDSMLRARNQTTVKAFISSKEDTFRPPYGRTTVTVKRSSIFVGTTNEEEFLTDETGNRRYWIVGGCNADINIALLTERRDQLWAEAVAAYDAGEEWWLTADEEAVLVERQGQHERSDAWMLPIATCLAGRTEVQIYDLLTDGLDIKPGNITRREEMRAVACLKRLGFEVRRVGKERTKVYRRETPLPAPRRAPALIASTSHKRADLDDLLK